MHCNRQAVRLALTENRCKHGYVKVLSSLNFKNRQMEALIGEYQSGIIIKIPDP